MSPVSRWRTILATVVIAYGVVILGGGIFIYSGAYHMGATEPHWPITQSVLETARIRSIKAHAADIEVPADLGDNAKIVKGVEHFADHMRGLPRRAGRAQGRHRVRVLPAVA